MYEVRWSPLSGHYRIIQDYKSFAVLERQFCIIGTYRWTLFVTLKTGKIPLKNIPLNFLSYWPTEGRRTCSTYGDLWTQIQRNCGLPYICVIQYMCRASVSLVRLYGAAFGNRAYLVIMEKFSYSTVRRIRTVYWANPTSRILETSRIV